MISQIRKLIYSNLGAKIVVLCDIGRNKKEQFIGKLYKAYNNVFLIIFPSGDVKSFNYVDILTKSIQICIEKC